jgi:hypothetical protein
LRRSCRFWRHGGRHNLLRCCGHRSCCGNSRQRRRDDGPSRRSLLRCCGHRSRCGNSRQRRRNDGARRRSLVGRIGRRWLIAVVVGGERPLRLIRIKPRAVVDCGILRGLGARCGSGIARVAALAWCYGIRVCNASIVCIAGGVRCRCGGGGSGRLLFSVGCGNMLGHGRIGERSG